MILDYSLKALHDDRSKPFSSVIFAFSGTGTMVAILKHMGTADWVREIEYVRKHSSQLVCACSEDAARDVVWACLARVNTLKCHTHNQPRRRTQSSVPGHVSGTVLSSKQVKVFSLSGSKTSVSTTWLVFLLLSVI